MKKRALAWGYIVSVSLFFLSMLAAAVYYLILHPDHEGEMDLWAKILLISTCGIFVALHIAVSHFKVKLSDAFLATRTEKLERITDSISRFLGYIVVLPIALVAVIITLPYYLIFGEKRIFKPLIKQGYKYSENKREKCHVLSSERAQIKVDYSFTEWLVSIDGGKFLPIVESGIGTELEREALRELLVKYNSAHPVDKQRGDVKPPKAEFVDFLWRNLASK